MIRVAKHHHLNSAKWTLVLSPCGSKHGVHAVHQIGTDHRDLVDHHNVQGTQRVSGSAVKMFVKRLDAEHTVWWNAEERVDGLPTNVVGGNTGWGNHRDVLLGVIHKVIQ